LTGPEVTMMRHRVSWVVLPLALAAVFPAIVSAQEPFANTHPP
jgi:hypothetical protein